MELYVHFALHLNGVMLSQEQPQSVSSTLICMLINCIMQWYWCQNV